jgi:hypothetical protein
MLSHIYKEGTMRRNLPVSAVMVILLLACAGSALNARDEHKAKKMQFLIEMKHTPEQCVAELDRVSAEAPKLLEQVEWGCMAGDHTGYLMVWAENEAAAKNMVPAFLRGDDTSIVALNKFTVEQIKSFHGKN